MTLSCAVLDDYQDEIVAALADCELTWALILGLLGLGKIGSRVARIATAFGMDVLAWSEHLTADRAAEAGAQIADSKADVLRRSDFVSIHLVLSDRTRGLLGLDVFQTEPLPADDPLRSLPNVLATPHLGYVTEQNYRTFYTDAVEDITAFLAGNPIRELVP